MLRSTRSALPLIFSGFILTACGGGGGGKGGDDTQAVNRTVSIAEVETNAPTATGNTAVDGFTWFNFRRAQLGLPALARNSTVDVAAQGHSDYQKVWGVTHYQTEGKSGFTGVCIYDNNADPLCPDAKVSRLEAANYHFTQGSYAFGEVISATSNPAGFDAAEGLVGAIYHRFVIFEPMFRQVGVGTATAPGGLTYFTTNFVADGLNQACAARGRVVTYPFADQQRVQRNFFSDDEVPDPVPDRNEVGYPISVHADIVASVNVQTFTVRPRGGNPLPVKTLTKAQDPQHTPSTAAGIVPLNILAPATTYEVQFQGTVEYGATTDCPALSVPVNLAWSFTTR